jgi:peptide/nickel transport system substrate-binding protein
MASYTDINIDKAIIDAANGKLSRRMFMERAIALGVGASMAGTMWSSRVMAATPQNGGFFRAGVSDANTTDSLDPGAAAGTFSIHLNRICRTYLTEVTDTNGLGPDSAESWEASPDAKEWRFKLYSGQTFHNGKELTAEDVVASLNFHRGESTQSGAKGLLLDVEDVHADGKLTVVVKMKIGTADLPYLLADYHLAIMPAGADGKADWASGIGAGPYKLESFQPGVQATFSKFPNYHRKSYFDQIKIFGVNDAGARVNGVMTGEFDAISDVDLKTVSLLGRRKGIEIDEVPSGQVISLDMRCTDKPFDNVDVRRALKYAFDRDAVRQKITLGHSTIGNDQPIGPVVPYYANLEQTTYDPDKARFHLKKAGAEGLKISVSTSDLVYNGCVDMCVLYAESAAKCGIGINVVREPSDNYWSNVWLKKSFAAGSYGARATPDMMFSTFFRDGAPWNITAWSDEKFQKTLVEAKGELDEAKRKEMYADMQSQVRDEGGQLVAFFPNLVMARQAKVKHGPNLGSDWQMEGGRAYSRWWFEG